MPASPNASAANVETATAGRSSPNANPCATEIPNRTPVNAPGPQANRAALREITGHWFDRGVSGFRVDMAASLVKDDPDLVETGRLWAEMRERIDRAHPECILLSE